MISSQNNVRKYHSKGHEQVYNCYFISPFKDNRRQEDNDLGFFLVTLDKKKSRNSKLKSIKRKQNK